MKDYIFGLERHLAKKWMPHTNSINVSTLGKSNKDARGVENIKA